MRLEMDIGRRGVLPEDTHLFDILRIFLLAIPSNDKKILLRRVK